MQRPTKILLEGHKYETWGILKDGYIFLWNVEKNVQCDGQFFPFN